MKALWRQGQPTTTTVGRRCTHSVGDESGSRRVQCQRGQRHSCGGTKQDRFKATEAMTGAVRGCTTSTRATVQGADGQKGRLGAVWRLCVPNQGLCSTQEGRMEANEAPVDGRGPSKGSRRLGWTNRGPIPTTGCWFRKKSIPDPIPAGHLSK